MSDGRNELGHALVEALLLGLILLVPVIWMLSVFAELHAAALGTAAGARESGFEASRATDGASADGKIGSAIGSALVDHGLDPRRASVRWAAPEGWRRNGVVEVVVGYEVPVFQVPLLGEVTDPSITVSASHVATIDPYRSRDDE